MSTNIASQERKGVARARVGRLESQHPPSVCLLNNCVTCFWFIYCVILYLLSTVYRVSTAVSNVFYKLCSILGLFKDLLSIERLLDSSVLQLIKTSLTTFTIENIQLLQLKAIGVTCAVIIFSIHDLLALVKSCKIKLI